MKKKLRLTKISNDEMKETKAGAEPPGCFCHCSCYAASDGYVEGVSEHGLRHLSGGTPASLPDIPDL